MFISERICGGEYLQTQLHGEMLVRVSMTMTSKSLVLPTNITLKLRHHETLPSYSV